MPVMRRLLIIGVLLCFGGLVPLASAQEAMTPQAAFEALQERGLTVDNGIDNATMIGRIEEGDLEAVRLFLQAGINPNLKDLQGRLPLLIAAERGYAEIVRLLLEAGANPALTDKHGRTPMRIALSRRHDEVVKALLTPQPARLATAEEPTKLFEQASVTFQTDLYAALEEAVARYDGDLLIYFYEPDDPSSQSIESVAFESIVFTNEEISAYINTHFARLAVEIGSATWAQLMERYRPGHPADWPHVVLDTRRSFGHRAHHGWGNAREATDLENILQDLKYAKEVGWARL